jgi:very-short-patch-repair endonuclease
LRRRAIAREAERFGGVLSRTALRGLGADRHVIAREAEGDRWAIHGAQTVAVHTRPLEARALWWRAVWESGSRAAALDGVSALLAAGVTGYDDPVLHVSVPDAFTPKRTSGVRVHRVVRLDRELVTDRGVPRVRPALAAVRAAHWAVSDGQAALVLVLPIQQGIVSGPQLRAASSMWSGRRRRALVTQLVQDITDGATSLGELDFARMCRERRLPVPERQVVRRTPRGRVYLDVRWRHARLVVEIDGAHHGAGLTMVSDHLRQNEVALTRDIVLRTACWD